MVRRLRNEQGMAAPAWLVPVGVVVGIVVLLVALLAGTYNSLVDKETAVDQAFADVDTQLQRRNDLIPNLVNAVRGILQQEQAVFVEIARARQAYAGARTPEDKLEAAGEVSSALNRLLVIVEAFPQLRSNENVLDLQVQLEGTENRIAQARRVYNQTVTDYNRSIRRFPRNMVAGMLGFDRRPLFEADVEARDAPTVDLLPTTTVP
jgi:LemA protein